MSIRSWMIIFVAAMCAPVARGELAFESPHVDLGRLRTGQAVEHRIAFANRGASPAQLVDAKASCGCLQPLIQTRTVAAGAKGSLLLHGNTLTAPAGSHTWQVQVRYSMDGVLHEAKLAVSAQVVQELLVEPPSLVVYADGPVKHRLKITDLRKEPLRITSARTSSVHLAVRLGEETDDGMGRRQRAVDVEVQADLPVGRHDEKVMVYTDDPDYRELTVPISVVKRSKQRYSALPAEVELAASAAQPMPSRIVTIRDTRGGLLRIKEAACSHPGVQCQWSESASAAATVKITADRAQVGAEGFAGTVSILFEPGGERLEIPVRCLVR